MSVLASALMSWLCINAPPTPEQLQQLEQLEQLELLTNELEPTQEAREALEGAIAETEARGVEVAQRAELRAALSRARLGLVWALLAMGEVEAAEAAMDEAIRSSMGQALEAGTFGAQVHALFKARQEALLVEGEASIVADCERCELLINEHRSPNPSEPLPLGLYRVWVVASDGRFEPAPFEVRVDEPGEDVAVPLPSFITGASANVEIPRCRVCTPLPLGPLGFAGVSMGVGGIATTIGGAVLASIEISVGDSTSEAEATLVGVEVSPQPRPIGLGFITAGLISITGGIVAIVFDYKLRKRERQRERPALSFSPTLTGVQLRGSF